MHTNYPNIYIRSCAKFRYNVHNTDEIILL